MVAEMGDVKERSRKSPPREKKKTSTVDIREQMRIQLTEKLSGLLMTAQELGFELATLNDPDLINHPVVVKARELIIKLKELYELQKKIRS